MKKLLGQCTAIIALTSLFSAHSFADDAAPPVTKPLSMAGLKGKSKAPQEEPPTTVIADELLRDQTDNTIIAVGHVEIDYGDRLILADKITYHSDTKVAIASGHVVIVDKDGSTTFADYSEVTGDMKKAFFQTAFLIFKDGSTASSATAVRQDGNRTDLQEGTYVPCGPCISDPERPRIWQVKAVHIIHDQEEHNLYFHDATFEAFGFPVAYTPYFSIPDPTVERRSGILAPLYRGSATLGLETGVPYYYVINRSQDITATPIITTQQGPALAIHYRYASEEMAVDLKGAVADSPNLGARDYLTGTATWNLNNAWRAGADVGVTSDTSFMRTYGFGEPSYLTTHPYIEGFTQRSYAVVEAYAFDNLIVTTANNTSSPLAGPLGAWNYTSAPDFRGDWVTSNVTTATLFSPTDNTSSRRLSADVGWHAPLIGPLGDLYQFDLAARSDAYNVVNVAQTSGRDYTGSLSRFIPTAALTWSWPFINHHDSFVETITPTIQGVLAPTTTNNPKIPNEDSLGFRFDDSNLFQVSRVPGYDLVESGSRVNYGVRWDAMFPAGGKIDALVGQSWHAVPDSLYNSSPADGSSAFSDYVASLAFHPGYTVDLTYQQRVNQLNMSSDWSEVGLAFGPPILRLASGYIFDRGIDLVDSGSNPVNQINFNVSSALSQYWSVTGVTRWDLGSLSGPLQAGGSVKYDDDCITLALTAVHSYTYTNPLAAASTSTTSLYRGGLTIGFQVTFKTVGGRQSGPL